MTAFEPIRYLVTTSLGAQIFVWAQHPLEPNYPEDGQYYQGNWEEHNGKKNKPDAPSFLFFHDRLGGGRADWCVVQPRRVTFRAQARNSGPGRHSDNRDSLPLDDRKEPPPRQGIVALLLLLLKSGALGFGRSSRAAAPRKFGGVDPRVAVVAEKEVALDAVQDLGAVIEASRATVAGPAIPLCGVQCKVVPLWALLLLRLRIPLDDVVGDASSRRRGRRSTQCRVRDVDVYHYLFDVEVGGLRAIYWDHLSCADLASHLSARKRLHEANHDRLHRRLDGDHGARPGALGTRDGHDLLPELDLELHAGGDPYGDLRLHHVHLEVSGRQPNWGITNRRLAACPRC